MLWHCENDSFDLTHTLAFLASVSASHGVFVVNAELFKVSYLSALKCVVYIELNMVRARVVKHPSEWPYSGYNEIQQSKRKKILTNYNRLRELLGFDTYEQVKTAPRKRVDSCLSNGDNTREDKWTDSIAVGSEKSIRNIKGLMGGKALGRKALESGESFQLREEQCLYIAILGIKRTI